MKVYEIQGGFGLDALSLAERPDAAPGPAKVLLRMQAVSLNYRDLLMVKGAVQPQAARCRCVPLSDGVGEVVAVGDGVTRVKVGDRVAGLFMPGWLERRADRRQGPHRPWAAAVDGMLAEHAVLHEEGVVAVPEHLSDEEAATLPCAARHRLARARHRGRASRPGDTVLVQGTGGVSLFALQFAKLHGARVIATSQQRRQADARAGDWAPPTASTTRRRPTGTSRSAS